MSTATALVLFSYLYHDKGLGVAVATCRLSISHHPDSSSTLRLPPNRTKLTSSLQKVSQSSCGCFEFWRAEPVDMRICDAPAIQTATGPGHPYRPLERHTRSFGCTFPLHLMYVRMGRANRRMYGLSLQLNPRTTCQNKRNEHASTKNGDTSRSTQWWIAPNAHSIITGRHALSSLPFSQL